MVVMLHNAGNVVPFVELHSNVFELDMEIVDSL